jgi:hypothetical protein
MPRENSKLVLHATFASALWELEKAIAGAGLPLQVFETGRSPQRQSELYAQGRVSGIGTGGKYVTRAKPWQSFHQFGMAADYVFNVDGKWTWDEPYKGAWVKYTQLAAAAGLRTLSFERPHVELPVNLSILSAGQYPPGGGAAWEDWLDAQVEGWGHDARMIDGITCPGAPAAPTTGARPPLEA